MATGIDRRRIPAALRACLSLAVVLSLCTAAGAVAAPSLTVPKATPQGETATLSVNTRGARGCRLGVRGPAGRRQSAGRVGTHSYTVRLEISRKAKTGTWTLRVRCRASRSAARRLRVSGNTHTAGRMLFTRVRKGRIGGKRPTGYTDPRGAQNTVSGPAFDLTREQLSGLGGGDGGRAERAIAWAASKLGSTEFTAYCLRFVAFAYAATVFPRTATIAANQLGPREGEAPARNAPRGALLWFTWGDANRGRNLGHVGIALGDGSMIHALDAVRIDQIDGSQWWRSHYRGWTPAPDSWPGRPPPAPVLDPGPAAGPGPTTTPPPPPPAGKVITVDNRVTNGMAMSQDAIPLRLTTRPETYCGLHGCNINGTERTSGQTYDSAVCQTTGMRFTNGNDSDPADDANPERFESTRYYGVRLGDGVFGYTSEVWIRAADRGGLGLPSC
jgi:cell wall-associated NlpC family hydrolase